ncbi:hypothetical protein BV923_20390 [Pectobacterium odoriferum]|uniref:hypothetical protein n=1 Tax=Pectobacterium odoriferum TaxID=78398 RepID=UPI000CD19729|nr:hypothetical protein [Pectobacterium odoriferum]POE19105.1 hypothetical protein BV923_20390 [Pectobacterium odoriferum]
MIIDTDILLEDPNVIIRIRSKNGIPCISDRTLKILNDNKSGKDLSAKKSKYIINELGKKNSLSLSNFPSGEKITEGDSLTEFVFCDGTLLVLERKNIKSNITEDDIILQLSACYGLVLITKKSSLKEKADRINVKAYIWTGPNNKRIVNNNKKIDCIRPFDIKQLPIKISDDLIQIMTPIKNGSVLNTQLGKKIIVGEQISSGGEGTIYKTNLLNEVCKIYHPQKLTILKQKKIELMTSRKIQRTGICWPSEILFNESHEFVGYLMPKASGRTIQSSMFVKPVLEKTFPNWSRVDLVKICISFLEHIKYLHELNIIVGDINPLNFLVCENSDFLWMVDTDSFQLEDFPCPVGTVNFTAPEIQGKSYSDYIRTKDHELFAIATMLFMLLHPGKPPYSQQGGGSPSDNIKAMNFPYRFTKDNQQYTGENAPQGPWQNIWNNLSFKLKEAFHNTFRLNRRTSIDEWLKLMKQYEYSISKGRLSNDLFPTAAYNFRDPVEITCSKCGSKYINSKKWVDKMQEQGKDLLCPQCVNRLKLARMASLSLKETQQVEQTHRNLNYAKSINYVRATSTKSMTAIQTRTNNNGVNHNNLNRTQQQPSDNLYVLLNTIFKKIF